MVPDAGAGAPSPDHLVVGHITKPHGTRGELFVLPLTDRPDDVFAPGVQLLLGDEEGSVTDDSTIVTVASARAFKRGLLVRLEEVADRADADTVAGLYLVAPFELLPPLDDDEVFYHELLGATVETVAGEHVGRVREVFETEPTHLLEVLGDDGRARLVPFASRIVRQVDRVNRRIVIDPPEGLLDL